MTQLTCQHCSASTNGVVLCARCQTTAGAALANVSAYHGQLFSLGSPVRVRGRRRGEPVDPTGNAAGASRADSIEAVAAATTNMLSTWARLLLEDRPQLKAPANHVTAMADFLTRNLTSVAVLEWAGELVRDLLTFEKRLAKVVVANQGYWYAGICGARTGSAIDDWCPHDLFARPGLSYIRCTSCGAHWSVDQRRAHVIEQAREALLPVSVIARAVVSLLEGEPSQQRLEARLRKWVERGDLEDYGVRVLSPGLQPRRVYRLGDVMDRLTREAGAIRG